MKRSTIEVLQSKVKRGGFSDSFPDKIMFSTPSAAKGGVYYFSLRIGRGIAERSGFRPGDRAEVMFDKGTGEGELIPSKNGRILITGDPKVADCPPVIYKHTWAEGVPSIGQRTPLDDVRIIGAMHIAFKFPVGTSFTTLAKDTHTKAVCVADLYQKHKDLVDHSGAAKRVSDSNGQSKRATRKLSPPPPSPHKRRWDD